MTTDLTQSSNDLKLPSDTILDAADTFTEPFTEFIDWVVGNPTSTYNNRVVGDYAISGCSQLNPKVESPVSHPLIGQMPFYHYGTYQQHEQNNEPWVHNSHITGLAITASGSCGKPKEAYHTGCVICGKSFLVIEEEITVGYLERSHAQGGSCNQRMARRRAFQAGMKAGSFILVPRGVSQATACNSIFHKIIPDNNQSNPGLGV